MDRQKPRDWVRRFNTQGPDGWLDQHYEGPKVRLTPAQLAQLSEVVETGPDSNRDGVVRWRRVDLKAVIAERFGVKYHERSVGKLLKALGFSRVSARPRHPAQDQRVIAEFRKNFAAILKVHLPALPQGTLFEVWFRDKVRTAISTVCSIIECSACRATRSGSLASAGRLASKNTTCQTYRPTRASRRSPPRSKPDGSVSKRINSSRKSLASTISKVNPGPVYIDTP